MYRVQINTLMVEASTPEEVVSLVNAVAGRIAPVVAPVATRTPAKAMLKKVSRQNGSIDAPVDERRGRILMALRDRSMMAGDLLEAVPGIDSATLHNDLARLVKIGAVVRGDSGYAVTNPSPATPTM